MNASLRLLALALVARATLASAQEALPPPPPPPVAAAPESRRAKPPPEAPRAKPQSTAEKEPNFISISPLSVLELDAALEYERSVDPQFTWHVALELNVTNGFTLRFGGRWYPQGTALNGWFVDAHGGVGGFGASFETAVQRAGAMLGYTTGWFEGTGLLVSFGAGADLLIAHPWSSGQLRGASICGYFTLCTGAGGTGVNSGPLIFAPTLRIMAGYRF